MKMLCRDFNTIQHLQHPTTYLAKAQVSSKVHLGKQDRNFLGQSCLARQKTLFNWCWDVAMTRYDLEKTWENHRKPQHFRNQTSKMPKSKGSVRREVVTCDNVITCSCWLMQRPWLKLLMLETEQKWAKCNMMMPRIWRSQCVWASPHLWHFPPELPFCNISSVERYCVQPPSVGVISLTIIRCLILLNYVHSPWQHFGNPAADFLQSVGPVPTA